MVDAEIRFEVSDYPPAKSEALSVLGATHPHASRVMVLLAAAHRELERTGFKGFGRSPIGLELVVTCPDDGRRSDATNYLGGVADVLENKARRGDLPHLETLGSVHLYENDRQIQEVAYRGMEGASPRYSVRVWALEPTSLPTKEVDDELSSGFSRLGLESGGFQGWVSFGELRDARISGVPQTGGVYVVLRPESIEPRFLDSNPGGRFKGKDPTVPLESLRSNWVSQAEVVYIGKAGNLRRRLGEFTRFGAGSPVGHWGGRLIWQLADAADLLVAWKETPGALPEAIESQLIAEFRATTGKPPFANDPHRLGA